MAHKAGIWAVTLWTAGRVPSLVSFATARVSASLLGRLVLERWEQMAASFEEITVDEFAVLPDRFRAVVHAPSPANIELGLAWFRAAVAQEARIAGLATNGIVWESGSDLVPVETADELVSWRRRIRTGRALGLSGRLPDEKRPTRAARFAAGRGPATTANG